VSDHLIKGDCLSSKVHFQLLPPARWRLLHAFYKRNHYDGFPRSGETVAVLLLLQKQVLAVARVTRQANERVIRGVWVDHGYRRIGYGQKLLACMAQEGWLSNGYCFAEAGLGQFYEAAGFRYLADQEAPKPIQVLKARCQAVDKPLLIFRYDVQAFTDDK